MRKHLLAFIFLVQSLGGFSQFVDDFDDGDITNNPPWFGDIEVFEVDTNFKLHLNDSVANTSYLTSQSQAIINANWEFEIKLAFSPSTSNYAKVYLVSDHEDLTDNLNGYFVKIGGESGSVDDVSLYSQNGDSETKIIDGTDGLAVNNPDLKVKVTRDAFGNWELFLDTSGTYFSEGNTFDDNIVTSSYFGVSCKYTSTRGDKFWFDNFIVTGFEDTTTYVEARQNDIIINEIFADPTPSIGLPEHEYIELYNTTNSAIDLTNWKITVGSVDKIFPPSVIEANSFVILIKDDVFDSFQNNISKIGFSSISLTNGGSSIVLQDKNGVFINAVAYTDQWYNDNNKNEGGWSIERINPYLFCEKKNNWKASVSNIGGTPGEENSVFGESVYLTNFMATKAFINDSNSLLVRFNKNINSLLLSDSSFFKVNNISAIKSNPIAPFFDASILTFNFNFLYNTTYTLSVNELTDCTGKIINNTLEFGIPDSALSNDIIINEVLFNPKDDGVDYIEIFNNSHSFFDLSKLRIANFFEFGGGLIPENIKIITEEELIIHPYTYLVLTTDSAKIKAQYECKYPYNFVQLASIPTLSNDSGAICIIHQSQNQIIDAFFYHEDMHFALLETTDGVSLERLDPDFETQNSNNWHSAASTVGFGTPTYKNSQEIVIQSIGEITVFPKSFTPNNDGYKDITSINWNFSKTNLVATIKIFDNNGRVVKNILNNEMIGNSGGLIWDGTSQSGLQLNTGMYIVWMEVFSENGNIEQFKKVVVLSR